ncbi:MAG: metal ABC transporter substrate-binding protein [Caldimicrobium sp.]
MLKYFVLFFFWIFLFANSLFAKEWVVSSHPLSKIWAELFSEEKLYVITPPKGEFHFTEPTVKDWEAIKRADFVIIVGSEPWAKRVYKLVPKEKIFSLAKQEEKMIDPHLWFDLNRVEMLLKSFLSHPKVQEKPYYEKAKLRVEQFLSKLRELQKGYSALSTCREKQFYSIGHQVFYYLFKDTGIKEVSLIRGHHHGEISPKRLKEILVEAKRNQVKKMLLAEREFVKYKDFFIKEGFQVYEVWTGDYDMPGTFIELMLKNLETFKIILNCH